MINRVIDEPARTMREVTIELSCM